MTFKEKVEQLKIDKLDIIDSKKIEDIVKCFNDLVDIKKSIINFALNNYHPLEIEDLKAVETISIEFNKITANLLKKGELIIDKYIINDKKGVH